jgi:hypothetical protein
MMNPEYVRFLAYSEKDRLDLFLGTAARLGTSVQNVEKDFWVCWTLDALFNGLPPGGPRLLFKGGTSLSKGHGLISRFSEDIDITVFREDLHQSVTVEQLEKLGTKARGRKLDAIREACSAFITGPLRDELERLFRETAPSASLRVESDPADREHQSLLLWYPRVSEIGDGYVGPAVKIEAGAKSALDPHHPLSIRPYLAEDLKAFNLDVPNVTTVAPARTLWDKVVILHGLRRWFEEKGELKGEGQRVSRHYYDLHQLLNSTVADDALNDQALGRDGVGHARMFFNRAAYDLNSAKPGSFALLPHGRMINALRGDYERMSGMIFGEVPDFDQVMESISALEKRVNQS